MKSDFNFTAFIKKQDKGLVMIVVGAIILALIVIAMGDGDTETPNDDKRDAAALEELCSQIEGVGECHIMVTYKGGEVYAVAVVCRGADDPLVRQRLTELITSVYGIGANRVSIQPMSG